MLITNYINSHQFSFLNITHIYTSTSPFSYHYLKSYTHYLFHGLFYELDSHPTWVFLGANHSILYCQIIFPEAHICIDNVPFQKFLLLFPSFKLLFTKGLCTPSFTVPGIHYLINPHNHLPVQFCNLA